MPPPPRKARPLGSGARPRLFAGWRLARIRGRRPRGAAVEARFGRRRAQAAAPHQERVGTLLLRRGGPAGQCGCGLRRRYLGRRGGPQPGRGRGRAVGERPRRRRGRGAVAAPNLAHQVHAGGCGSLLSDQRALLHRRLPAARGLRGGWAGEQGGGPLTRARETACSDAHLALAQCVRRFSQRRLPTRGQSVVYIIYREIYLFSLAPNMSNH
mmetsp:Transcript_25504/g.81842  ORF Transcript_25504/g.81842 Transcript_25504/m.81842 type:complete len:212 (+) Transcript_25504:429-1064(+)